MEIRPRCADCKKLQEMYGTLNRLNNKFEKEKNTVLRRARQVEFFPFVLLKKTK